MTIPRLLLEAMTEVMIADTIAEIVDTEAMALILVVPMDMTADMIADMIVERLMTADTIEVMKDTRDIRHLRFRIVVIEIPTRVLMLAILRT